MAYQALKSNKIRLNKSHLLSTLRQLCAFREILPKSCVLPIEYKPSGAHHAAGGFADVWKGTHEGKEVAFKSLRGSTLSDDTTRSKRKVRHTTLPRQGTSVTSFHCFREDFARR